MFQASPNIFWKEFSSNLTALNYSPREGLRQAGYTFDAVWAAAFALHNASLRLEAGEVGGQTLSLGNYDYSRSDINEIILSAAQGLNFRGVTVSRVACRY